MQPLLFCFVYRLLHTGEALTPQKLWTAEQLLASLDLSHMTKTGEADLSHKYEEYFQFKTNNARL